MEFLTALLRSGSDYGLAWGSRVDELGVVRSLDYGNVISLTLPDSRVQLQELVDAWHDQVGIHALIEEAPVVLRQLGRYRNGRKIISELRLMRTSLCRVFRRAFGVCVCVCVWLIYRPIAAIIHLGPHAQEGHYRTVLRSGDSWAYTDDNVEAAPCDIDDTHFRNVCLLWVARPVRLH